MEKMAKLAEELCNEEALGEKVACTNSRASSTYPKKAIQDTVWQKLQECGKYHRKPSEKSL